MTDGRNPPSSVVCRPSSMDHQLPMADVIGAGRLCSATPVFGLPPLFMSCYLPFSTFNPSRVARERGSFVPRVVPGVIVVERSEEHTSELQSRPHLVCRLLLEKKK